MRYALAATQVEVEVDNAEEQVDPRPEGVPKFDPRGLLLDRLLLPDPTSSLGGSNDGIPEDTRSLRGAGPIERAMWRGKVCPIFVGRQSWGVGTTGRRRARGLLGAAGTRPSRGTRRCNRLRRDVSRARLRPRPERMGAPCSHVRNTLRTIEDHCRLGNCGAAACWRARQRLVNGVARSGRGDRCQHALAPGLGGAGAAPRRREAWVARAAGESRSGKLVRRIPSKRARAEATAAAVGTRPISPTPLLP